MHFIIFAIQGRNKSTSTVFSLNFLGHGVIRLLMVTVQVFSKAVCEGDRAQGMSSSKNNGCIFSDEVYQVYVSRHPFETFPFEGWTQWLRSSMRKKNEAHTDGLGVVTVYRLPIRLQASQPLTGR